MSRRAIKPWLILGLLMACVLLSIGSAVAFSRGYLIRFIVDDVEISRDEFMALAEASMAGQPVRPLYCAQMQFSLRTGFVTHCFDTHEEVSAFLDNR